MESIIKEIDDLFELVVNIRRTLHENPEVSQQEVETAAYISALLTGWGISHKTGVAGYGIVATIEGKGKVSEKQRFRTVAVRADIDALPIEEKADVVFQSRRTSVMHACGHDIHTAILLGTAKIFKGMEETLVGNVKFFFEPAEETIGGAKEMINQGCLKNPQVDAVIGLHIAPQVEVGRVEFRRGKMNAASTEFKIVVEGISCHGAHPENGIDTVVVAAQMVCALQSIVNRNLAPTNPGVVTIGQIHGGNKNNVVAKETRVSGIIRALDEETRSFIKARVQGLAEGVVKGFGATVKVEFTDSYPALVNDPELGDILERTAERVLSKKQICFLQEPSLGADDFSYFAEAVQAVYFNIGCCAKEKTHHQMLHNEFLNPHEGCIRVGMLMEVFGVLDILAEGTEEARGK